MPAASSSQITSRRRSTRAWQGSQRARRSSTPESAEIAASQRKLDAGRAKLAAGERDLDAGRAKLVAGQKELDAGKATITEKQAEIDDGRAKLADGQAEIDAGWVDHQREAGGDRRRTRAARRRDPQAGGRCDAPRPRVGRAPCFRGRQCRGRRGDVRRAADRRPGGDQGRPHGGVPRHARRRRRGRLLIVHRVRDARGHGRRRGCSASWSPRSCCSSCSARWSRRACPSSPRWSASPSACSVPCRFSGVVEMVSVTPVLGVMLGLAVGIDYALFIVNRHRRQLMDGYAVGGVHRPRDRHVGQRGRVRRVHGDHRPARAQRDRHSVPGPHGHRRRGLRRDRRAHRRDTHPCPA